MSASLFARVVFWACTLAVVYAYLLYPLLIWLLGRVFGRPSVPPLVVDDDLPRASLLIAAHDEEAVIAARIENALAMDYPAGKFEVVIGSDGSTDRTSTIVKRYAGRGVRLLDYGIRRGKASVLNDSIPRLNGDIVLFSDANTDLDPQAARRLARWFRDPGVGSVVGRLRLIDPESGQNVDGLYWRYETFLKTQEARLGGLLGANGAIYAMRRELYTPIPAQTIIDDFVAPLLARIRSGCRLIYDREATAAEETAPDIAAEFRRRVRIGAGGFQSLGILHGLLNPRQGWVAFTFVSHKLMRWLCPFFLLGMLAASVALGARGSTAYLALMSVQVVFYVLTLGADLLPEKVRNQKVMRLGVMFTEMNLALLVGFWRWLLGLQKGTWSRTVRTLEVGVVR